MMECTTLHLSRGRSARGGTREAQPSADVPSPSPLALIANSQEWTARSLASILGPVGYTVLRVVSGKQAVEYACSAQPDLILLDMGLPDSGGAEICRILRGEGRVTAVTPILITLQGPATREQRIAGLRAGAWEMVGLPVDAEELLLKLETFGRAKACADSVREMGLLDEETGFYNIRGLLRRAREMGAAAVRHHRALGCAVLALEGEPDGDVSWLSAVSENERRSQVGRLVRIFRSTARASDVVGRLGPVEFVLLAPDTDAAGVLAMARRITRAAATVYLEGGSGIAPLRVRAGCYAVPDFAVAKLEPVELLVRATASLRGHRGADDSDAIRFFDAPVPATAPVG